MTVKTPEINHPCSFVSKLLVAAALGTSSAGAFTAFVDAPTTDDSVLLVGNNGGATITDTLLAQGGLVDFRIGVVGDRVVSFDETGNGTTGDNNNPSGVTGPVARVTVTNLVGGPDAALRFSGRDLFRDFKQAEFAGANPDNVRRSDLGSFFVSTVGSVTSFNLTIEYLNANGDALLQTTRVNTNQTFGPIIHVNTNGFLGAVGNNLTEGQEGENFTASGVARATTVNLGVLQSDLNNVFSNIDDVPFRGLSGRLTSDVDDYPTASNDGILTFELADETSQYANIRDFNDDSPNNTQNDFFSGVSVGIAATDDTLAFAENTVFNLSFDSQIIAATVPEPTSAALLSLATLALLVRRSRKSS